MHDATETGLLIENRLLQAVPPQEFEALRPYIRRQDLKPGTIIAHTGDEVRDCYFPSKGMISLLSETDKGSAIEVGFTGREGMVGLAAVLGKKIMPCQALVQADTECLVIDAAVVAALFREEGRFHDLVLRYVYAVMRQIAQTCVCNHFHTIEARLCRWLSVMTERSGDRRLSVTQEFLAYMLGVQRTSIGPIANGLQQAGIIRYSRGRVEIIDIARLKRSACECYKITKREYEELYDGV